MPAFLPAAAAEAELFASLLWVAFSVTAWSADPADVAYLTGFLGGDSYLLLTGSGKPALISDHRYLEDLEGHKKHCRVVMRKGSIWAAVALTEPSP